MEVYGKLVVINYYLIPQKLLKKVYLMCYNQKVLEVTIFFIRTIL